MNRKPLLYGGVILASMVYFAGLLYYAQVRPLDGDEGYYTSAARLVWEGKTPYRDFSYPQGVLLPYIYSWVWAIHPHSLVSMRLLSSTFGAVAILLWGLCLLSVKPLSTKVALATFLVIFSNPYWVWWNVSVKTFAVANLFMSIAMICLYAALHTDRLHWLLIGGMALGACASVRSLYAPLVPAVLLWLLHREWRMSKWPIPKTLTFLWGSTCGVLPMIIIFGADPQAFVFNNVKYRSLLSPHVSFRHSVHVYLNNLLSLLHHTYFVMLVLLAILGAISLWKLRKKQVTLYTIQDYQYIQLVSLMLVVYIATASIPFPVYDQYFTSPLVPFLVAFVAEGLRVTLQFGTKSILLLAVVALILFFRGIKSEAAEYSEAPQLQIASYHKITRILETNSTTNNVVLSIWPGYVFESGRRYFPGSENHFNYAVACKITPEERARYHVLAKEEVFHAVSTRGVDMFVSSASRYYLDATMTPAEQLAFRTALDANYSLVVSIDHVDVYRLR